MRQTTITPPPARPLKRSGTALLLAVLMALANYLLWGATAAPIAAPDILPRVNGLAYAPFARADAPGERHSAAAALIDADLRQLAGITGEIRTYTAAQLPQLPALAARHGLRLTLGAWLDRDLVANERELAAALAAARTHQNIRRLLIGNEAVLKGDLTPAQLVAYLKRARAAAPVPVSSAEPWHVWIKHPELVDAVDFITVHLLPYWEGVGQDTAVDEAFERLARVRARFPGKPILVGETGYPSSGDSIKRARPTPAAQAAYIRQFVDRARQEKLDYFLIEAYDQPWKQQEEGRAGAYWGLFDAARQPKFAFQGAIEPDPYWRSKALYSSGAGLLFLLWFLRRAATANLRPLAQVAFAATAQAVLSFATVLLTLPLLHYMDAADWVMLGLLIPTSMVMVAIMLAHLFEFVEIFWDGSLKRRFTPQPLAPAAAQPFVSIHLACSNEAPYMVIAAIRSLVALDYRAFEVLIVDNNTKDPALWQPVRDFVAGLPANFRFIHLPVWPGFKAGVLNHALTLCDPRTELVGVVDADYVVRPDWLAALVGHFADSQVGVVQAPQAHRDWSGQLFRKMMNWEYEGFFRIGMHHRNERDAIIQHGTMTLIRASALRRHGQWAQWCMCEDTELGLRLMQQGLRTVYVDQVMGYGLTPDSFAAFKRQRSRWARGGMQIFKAHWRALLGTSRLSLGQRYHFLAGWLPWIGDALHLVFVLAALLWTAGALAWPRSFPLPIALLMLPLAAFCAAKLVIGPLLYWRRVACSAGEIAGAAIAGMALSHAIARGVLAGLTRGAGVFRITAKGGQAPAATHRSGGVMARLWRLFAPAREECLLLAALLSAIAAVGLTRTAGHLESAWWMLMLGLQCLPYVAALVCACAAALPARRTGVAEDGTRLPDAGGLRI